MKAKSYYSRACAYARDVVAGKRKAGNNFRECVRFLADLKRDDLTLRKKDADFVCGFIEQIFVHEKGETIDGKPLKNKPLLLQDWQIFIVYNLLGFYWKGTNERRYKESRTGRVFVLRPLLWLWDSWSEDRDLQSILQLHRLSNQLKLLIRSFTRCESEVSLMSSV